MLTFIVVAVTKIIILY